MIRKGFFPEMLTSKIIPDEVKEFINRIVPEKYQKTNDNVIAERGRLLLDIEYTTPSKILKNDIFFKEFRNI